MFNKNNVAVGFSLGYENAPYNYILTPHYDKRTKLKSNTILLPQNQSLKITLFLYCFEATNESAIGDVVENVYKVYHEPPKKVNSLTSATKDISNAIYKDSYFEEYKNYATTVKLLKGEIKKEINISIGWTGGVEIATPLLMAGLRLQDDNMRQQSLNCIQNIVDNSFNDNAKLPNDAFDGKIWSSRGWWAYGIKIKGLTSYVLGQAIYYILKAYEYEKNIKNVVHEDWMVFCRKSLITMSHAITENGEFPYIFSEQNGKGIEYDSFAGCWCFASMVYYQKLSEEKIFEKHFEKCDSFYYSFVEKYECYGTPLDTYKAVDSEGILAYIKAVKLLHEIYGKECYLSKLSKALRYEFSFKFCYNVPTQVNSLKKLDWSSAGGSVTSTCNPHIHPMSNNVIDEMMYLSSTLKTVTLNRV